MKWFLLVASVLAFPCFGERVLQVEVIQEQRELYKRDHYLYELLEKALHAGGIDAALKPVKVHPHQQRALMMLAQGEADVHWSMTSPERELLAIAVKVPLFRGYIGKRALLIHADQQARFRDIASLEELKKFVAVQGHDWPDTKILSANNLPVRPQVNYDAMFSLIARKKVDYFPRSFIEVHAELRQFAQFNLAIAQNVYIEYPAAFYFFVNKEKPQLAKAIEAGLGKLEKSGEFKALFDKYFAEELANLPTEKAHVIHLENPFLNNEEG
ncbi:hypothetical protein PALB_19320 [Pseudoalteromonas luteoviolacea B = ATCC 29581]|nr:hypothetical protein PALB_19320 [Pseudoalteromonas luteoviolacea B = ATCC 29581]